MADIQEVRVDAGDVFGEPYRGIPVMQFQHTEAHPDVPPMDDCHIHRRDLLRVLFAFHFDSGGDGLFFTGPTGCGKTTEARQFAARLGIPVQEVTLSGRTELADLIGQHMLVNGEMRFVHGPVAKAVRDGHWLIMNEIDVAEPAELTGLNEVLDGAPLTIPQNNGEVIYPHPNFRLIATGNSAGQGDATGLYQGILQQNLAFLDRFVTVPVDYPDEATEDEILKLANPKLRDRIRERMIRTANEVRRLFMGGGSGEEELSVTMSTRTIVRWARLVRRFKGAPNPLEYGLQLALTARAEPEQAEAIHRIAQNVFGELWQEALNQDASAAEAQEAAGEGNA